MYIMAKVHVKFPSPHVGGFVLYGNFVFFVLSSWLLYHLPRPPSPVPCTSPMWFSRCTAMVAPDSAGRTLPGKGCPYPEPQLRNMDGEDFQESPFILRQRDRGLKPVARHGGLHGFHYFCFRSVLTSTIRRRGITTGGRWKRQDVGVILIQLFVTLR